MLMIRTSGLGIMVLLVAANRVLDLVNKVRHDV
jgi:hypothetical protein